MPFFTRCTYCRQGYRLPDRALTESAKCTACGSWFTAMAEKEPERPGRARAAAAATPTAPRAPNPPPAGEGDGAVATLPEPAKALTEYLDESPHTGAAAEPPDEAPDPPLLGVAACLLAGAALVCAAFSSSAFLARPLAGVGGAVGLVGALASGGGAGFRRALPLAGAVVAAAVLAAATFAPALLGPGFERSRQTSTYDPEVVRLIPLRLAATGSDGLETDGYADASRAAIQQGSFRVRVVSAAVAPVQVVDAKARYTKKSYLIVAVQIQHTGAGERVRLVHWGTTGERVVPDATATANGRTLAPADLDREVPVGISYGQELFPAGSASDVLIFDPPAPGAAVRLDLPAEAWGGRGAFKFQLPGSMIVTHSGKGSR